MDTSPEYPRISKGEHMFDITKVLNRSWHILWKYRILWVFGFFLAMAAGTASRPNFSWIMSMDNHPQPWRWSPHFGNFLGQTGDKLIQMLITCGIILLVVGLIYVIVATFLKYISAAATIRAVNDYEDTSIKAGFKQIWKTGWNITAWRLFLIGLLISLPFILMVVLMILAGLWVYFAATSGSQAHLIFSIVTSAGLGLLVLLLFIVLGVILGVIYHFAARICVLEGAGVIDSIKQGYAFVRRHLKDVFFMWLVMVGISIAWGGALFFLMFPIVFVSLFLILPAVLAGVIPGLVATGLAALFQMPSPWYWVVGTLVAAPFVGLVMGAPMLLVTGWTQIFSSSIWTETYRDLKALEMVKPVVLPAVKTAKPAAIKPATKPTTKSEKAVKPAATPAKTSVKTVKPAAKSSAKPAKPAKSKTTPK
jgi:hypothetical protein